MRVFICSCSSTFPSPSFLKGIDNIARNTQHITNPSTKMMKAIRFHPPGGPDKLLLTNEPIPVLSPANDDDEVLIKVHATSIIAPELTWPIYQLPSGSYKTHIPGHDFSGTIASIAPNNARGLKSGDEVMAFTSSGAFDGGMAEYAKAYLSEVVSKPESLDLVQAASVPLSALTAWQALFDHCSLAKGQRVLVTGAAGATGLWAVQIAKKLIGAEVVGTASSARSFELLAELGVDRVVDYKKERVDEVVGGVDVVLDTVAGNLDAAVKTLKPEGVYISITDFEAGEKAAFLGRKGLMFVVSCKREQLERIRGLVDDGTLKVFVDSVFVFEDVKKAFERGFGAHAKGKIVLKAPGV